MHVRQRPTPVPPPSPDPEPGEEPTLAGPPPGEAPQASDDDVVIEPPVPGEPAATAAPNQRLIIGVAVAAAIIVIGGIIAAILLLGGDDDGDDEKAEEKTSSIEDFCAVIEEMDASEDTRDDPTIVSNALRDAGTPEEMGDEEKAGRDLLIKIGDESEDGPAAEEAVQALDTDETAQVQAFVTYITTACAKPSESPS